MTAPSEDAVGVAREESLVEVAMDAMHFASAANRVSVLGQHQNVRKMMREVIAAVESRVRAECAAKVEALRIGTNPDDRDTDIAYDSAIADVLRAFAALDTPPNPRAAR